MPFTPIHLGAGALAKAALGHRFSFTVFASTQIAMDIEPGLKMLGILDGPLHGPTHTWPGAILIGLACALLYAWLQTVAPQSAVRRIGRIPFPVIFYSTLFGTLSHVALDALMHADMSIAFVSLYRGNLGSNAGNLPEQICITALMLSLPVWLIRRKLNKLITEGRIPSF